MIYDLYWYCDDVLVERLLLFLGMIIVGLYWIDIKELLIIINLEV